MNRMKTHWNVLYLKIGAWLLLTCGVMGMKYDDFWGEVNQTTQFYYGRFLLTLLLMIVAGYILIVAKEKHKYSVPNMFLAVAGISGLLMVFANPAVQECDGWEHFVRVVDVSYGEFLQPFADLHHSDGVIQLPDNYMEFYTEVIEPDSGDANDYENLLKTTSFSKQTLELEYPSAYVSLFYLPQGIGMGAARLMGLSAYWCIIFGRILNLAAYLALCYLAIKLIPIMRDVMLVVALLPLSIYQAASLSPDSILHGLCFLFIALCFHYAYEYKEKLGARRMIWLGVLLALLFMCKYVYICLGLLVFVIPKDKFTDNKGYWKAFGIAMIPIVVCVLLMAQTLTGSVGLMSAQTLGMTQSQYVYHNPVGYMMTFVRTMETYFTTYVNWMNTLGSLNYGLGPLLTILPCFFVGVVCLDGGTGIARVKMKDRWLCILTFGVVIFLTMTGIYIGDGRVNPVGANYIMGGQGRYFIPILYLAAVALASRRVEHHIVRFTEKITGCMAVMLALSGIMLMATCY